MLIDIINTTDTFPYSIPSSYYTFVSHDGINIGYLDETIAIKLGSESGFSIDGQNVKMDPQFNTFDQRNQLMEEIGVRWKELPEFASSLKHGWRNELYTIYNPSHMPYMLIERAFSVLLGVVTYGVHITGYVETNGKYKLWIPRRAANKPTYPGKLDNTVAGGLGYPYGVSETLFKECYEEAGLPESLVVQAKPVGVLSYMYVPKGETRVQPEVEYLYDLKFDDTVPKPMDGEAEDFKLMDVEEVLKRLENGEFKPNCGLVIIDFLIRHGYLTSENTADYVEMVSRSHRVLPFPLR